MERPISARALDEVQSAVFKGERIAAIKIYREDTGASLKDAKDAIEKLEAEWRTAHPERFTARPRKRSGCGICLLLVLIGIGMAIFLALLFSRHAEA
jgi:hypothetical protein